MLALRCTSSMVAAWVMHMDCTIQSRTNFHCLIDWLWVRRRQHNNSVGEVKAMKASERVRGGRHTSISEICRLWSGAKLAIWIYLRRFWWRLHFTFMFIDEALWILFPSASSDMIWCNHFSAIGARIAFTSIGCGIWFDSSWNKARESMDLLVALHHCEC